MNDKKYDRQISGKCMRRFNVQQAVQEMGLQNCNRQKCFEKPAKGYIGRD